MLQVRTFGGLSVERDGAACGGAASRRKTLALLALLAATGKKGMSREKLVTHLWPESDATHGRDLLKHACYALRRDLDEPDLFLGQADLRLNPAVVASDVQAFEDALRQGDLAGAATLYAGPFLDGFYVDGAGEFEHWATAQRARLANRASTALGVKGSYPCAGFSRYRAIARPTLSSIHPIAPSYSARQIALLSFLRCCSPR